MSDKFNVVIDQEVRQLEVETFEIEDLAEVEQVAAGSSSTSSTSTCSSTTSCTSTGSGSTAAMQPVHATNIR